MRTGKQKTCMMVKNYFLRAKGQKAGKAIVSTPRVRYVTTCKRALQDKGLHVTVTCC